MATSKIKSLVKTETLTVTTGASGAAQIFDDIKYVVGTACQSIYYHAVPYIADGKTRICVYSTSTASPAKINNTSVTLDVTYLNL
jgi:hypothetical protein